MCFCALSGVFPLDWIVDVVAPTCEDPKLIIHIPVFLLLIRTAKNK